MHWLISTLAGGISYSSTEQSNLGKLKDTIEKRQSYAKVNPPPCWATTAGCKDSFPVDHLLIASFPENKYLNAVYTSSETGPINCKVNESDSTKCGDVGGTP